MISVDASHVILFDEQRRISVTNLSSEKKLSRFSEHLISGFHGDMYMEIRCPIGGQWSAKCEVSGYHGYRSSVSDEKSLVRIVFDLLSVDCMFLQHHAANSYMLTTTVWISKVQLYY